MKNFIPIKNNSLALFSTAGIFWIWNNLHYTAKSRHFLEQLYFTMQTLDVPGK